VEYDIHLLTKFGARPSTDVSVKLYLRHEVDENGRTLVKFEQHVISLERKNQCKPTEHKLSTSTLISSSNMSVSWLPMFRLIMVDTVMVVD
jgi:hypothetical protein